MFAFFAIDADNVLSHTPMHVFVLYWPIYFLMGVLLIVGISLSALDRLLGIHQANNRKDMCVAQISLHRINDRMYGSNIWDTIAYAKELGVAYIEFDVRRTSDHVMVAWHDEELPSGRLLSDAPYAVYEREAAGMACAIEDLIKATGGCPRLQVDLKETGYEDEIVKLLLAHISPEGFVITSLEDESIQHIKKAFPMVRCGLSLGRNTTCDGLTRRLTVHISELFPGRRLKSCKADFVSVNYRLARVRVLRYCRKHHLPAWVWTVDDVDDMSGFLLSPEVETLITNAPDVAITLGTRLTARLRSTTA